ncbi:MAG: hypothetical protein Q8N51_12435 [Gammaproteobacteria bacterium]|nr:hypothetical protein [Gammaproteobacteria bacterium]
MSEGLQIQMSASHKGVGSVTAGIWTLGKDGRLGLRVPLGELPVRNGMVMLPEMAMLVPGEYLAIQATEEIAW